MRTTADSTWILYAGARYFRRVGIGQGAPRALRCGMELSVKDVRFGVHAGLSAEDEAGVGNEQEARTYPTPAEVFAQIGRVIAFCLGLAVLAHVIVALVGTQ